MGCTVSLPARQSPPSHAQVEIFQPGVDATMEGGTDVSVTGTVTGLGGSTLWVVARPDVGGEYYPTQSTPVTDRDGRWSTVSEKMGDKSDVGHNIVFIVLQADPSCSETLEAVPEQDGSRKVTRIPGGCVVLAERSVAVTH